MHAVVCTVQGCGDTDAPCCPPSAGFATYSGNTCKDSQAACLPTNETEGADFEAWHRYAAAPEQVPWGAYGVCQRLQLDQCGQPGC